MRVKRGNVARNRRKKVLKLTKGFRASRSKLFRPAHQAMLKALTNAFKDRRRKKSDFRGLWISRINAALFNTDISYSKFMGLCKTKNIEVNRKILAELALSQPTAFNQFLQFVVS